MLDRDTPRISDCREILMSECEWSMSDILPLWLKVQFFFEPAELNVPLSDYAIQFINEFAFRFSFFGAFVGENG